MADYAAALGRLRAMGLIYPCFCTRRDIAAEVAAAGAAPHGSESPPYPGLCKALGPDEVLQRQARGDSFALRLHTDRALAQTGPLDWHDERAGRVAADAAAQGDVVLARKDTPASYHLAVTVDDALQGVTHVIRGVDLFAATHVHRVLQALLGLPVPAYHHHALLTDASGRRYAKRDRAQALAALRRDGVTPAQIRGLVGLNPLAPAPGPA